MLQIIQAIWETLKTIVDCCIIWVIGPDGVLFDIQSILAIIVSGITVLASLGGLIWKLSQKM